MSILLRNWRFVIEIILFLFSGILVWLHQSVYGLPEGIHLAILSLYTLYFLFQFKWKLGVTIAFVFIVAFSILAILQWQQFQSMQSFDLSDYRLAIAYVLNALTCAIIYFEHKLRW